MSDNANKRKTMVERLKKSPAYRIAYHDYDFISAEDQRPVRLQLELLKPEQILRRENILSTIVVFGGTRIMEPAKAAARVAQIEKRLKKNPHDVDLKKLLRRARSIHQKAHYYDEAREFGRIVSEECQFLDGNQFVIVTGGGPGIMEAANRGAYDARAKSIGLNIAIPLEQEPNPYISPELCLQFHYFALRKMHFLMRAKALVAFPGGFGTMDEVFEALTLIQTRVTDKLPIVLFGEKYWRKVINMQALVEEGTIDEDDLSLFVYADKAADAWKYIKYFYESNGNGIGKRQ
jgi:uncharacterized protein (TIGR00730 family)